MSIQIAKHAAEQVLLKAGALADADLVSSEWEGNIRRLSLLCEDASKTHIAFIGTAILAKATDARVDVFALHVVAGTTGAYSARALAKDVLAPHARALKISLGVTGREPLNNQPYFRHHVVARDMTVRANARPALNAVCDLLDELQTLSDQPSLLAALAAFIKVRREYWVSAGSYIAPATSVAFLELIGRIEAFVQADAEGGRRAQAVAAGLMDVIEGSENVETARINDPDRHFPGDVAVWTSEDRRLTRVIEVRDKPVTQADLHAFADKAARSGVARAGMLAVAPQQQPLDIEAAQRSAATDRVNFEVFMGWGSYLRQLLFWLPADIRYPIEEAHQRIHERLIQLECSTEAQNSWLQWTQ